MLVRLRAAPYSRNFVAPYTRPATREVNDLGYFAPMTSSSESPVAALEPRLTSVLGWVDGHLRFAETKNAVLLAADAAIAAGTIQTLASASSISVWTSRYLVCLALACLISGCIALLSFLPVTQIPWLTLTRRGIRQAQLGWMAMPRRSSDTGNLLFFGDIRGHNGASYLAALSKATGISRDTFTPLERMYADQIVVNAGIAFRKFSYFRVAIWVMIFGAITPLFALPLLMVVADRQD